MNVVIIGADSGIGEALAGKFLIEGHNVAIGALDPEKAALKYDNYKNRFISVHANVTDENTLKSAVARIRSEWGSVDAVIVVAGVLPQGDRVNNLLEADLDELRLAFEVNAVGIIVSFRNFYPILTRDSGTLLAITAGGGCFAMDGLVYPAYCVSKTAANKIVLTIKNTVQDARVLAVHPGVVNTGMGRPANAIEPEESAAGIYNIVLGKTHIDKAEWFIDYKGNPLPL